LERAKPAIEFKIDAEIDRLRAGFDTPAKIAPKAEALIRQLTPREEWDRWRVYVAGRLQVNVDDLRNSRFLANGANFAPRSAVPASGVGSRHVRASIEPLSFEREVISIVLEDPALATEYAGRIPSSRFRNEIYRRIYERVVEDASTIRTMADVFGLFAEDQASLDALATLGRRDRSSTIRYGDSGERRTHLERVVERLQHEDEQRRYQEVSRLIDEHLAAGRPVSDELRGEFETLVARLKR
jgi:hypothetical protein